MRGRDELRYAKPPWRAGTYVLTGAGRSERWAFAARRVMLLIVAAALTAAGVAAGGCVQRRLVLESDPPGALVFLNGEEVARTPAEVPLHWYGRYDVVVRREGYETLKQDRWVIAPWWQWPPIDLVAEIVPLRLTDRRRLHFVLQPAEEHDEGLVERAEDFRAETLRERPRRRRSGDWDVGGAERGRRGR